MNRPAPSRWFTTHAFGAGRLRTFLRRGGVRGFSHVLTGNALVTVSQAVQFLLLARVLGPVEFGKIAAVASVTAVLTPFSGMGAANVMMMRASRDVRLLPTYFGNALLNATVTGSLLTLFAGAFATPLLGAKGSLPIMLVFCASELIFSKFIDICWQAFVSNERLHWTSILLVVQSVSKLIAVALFIASRGHRADVWIWWSLTSNVAVAAWIVYATARRIGRPTARWRLALAEFPLGIPFAVGLSAKGFYTDADKVFLARYGAAQSLGMYTVAYRIVQMALVPIRAVSMATTARYFRAGEAGVEGTIEFTRRIAKLVMPMAVLLGVGFFLVAPLIPVFTGEQYAASVVILRWFAGLPILLAAQSLLSDALAGCGNQRAAATIQVISAGLACVACILLIPRFDWRGAVIASYGSQSLLTGMLAVALWRLRRTSPRS